MNLPTTWKTAHIINNSEIGITECGLMIAVIPETDRNDPHYHEPKPVGSLKGDEVAIWDDTQVPPGHATCRACSDAYNAL